MTEEIKKLLEDLLELLGDIKPNTPESNNLFNRVLDILEQQ